LVFEVLRAPVKGRGGGWTSVGGVCASVTATLHCDGHHSRVSVPRLEVQTSIRKGDRRCREGKERRHDTRAHEQERGGWRHVMCFTVRRSLFSLVQNRVLYLYDLVVGSPVGGPHSLGEIRGAAAVNVLSRFFCFCFCGARGRVGAGAALKWLFVSVPTFRSSRGEQGHAKQLPW
jgi:hypothetical protein